MYLREEIQQIKQKLCSQNLSDSEQLILLRDINNILIYEDYGEDKDFFIQQYENLIEKIGKKSNQSGDYCYLKYKAYFYYIKRKTKRLLTLINSFNLHQNNDILILLVELCINDNYNKNDVFELVEIIIENGIFDFYLYQKLEGLLHGNYDFHLPNLDIKNTPEYFGEGTFSPMILEGSWDLGYCLDYHTILDSNALNGYTKSYIGNLLYEIKYRYNQSFIPIIGKISSDFLGGKYKRCTKQNTPFEKIDFIILTPPSKLDRPFQPVFEIGKEISKITKIPIYNNLLYKRRKTPQTKSISFDKAQELLNGIFEVKNTDFYKKKNILILDDLFGTGLTLNEIAKTIRKNTNVNKIYVFTLTKTRTKYGLRN